MGLLKNITTKSRCSTSKTYNHNYVNCKSVIMLRVELHLKQYIVSFPRRANYTFCHELPFPPMNHLSILLAFPRQQYIALAFVFSLKYLPPPNDEAKF
jgi:hypothetical protein